MSAAFGQVERDLRARIAHADDQHVLSGIGRRFGVGSAVQHLALEILDAREIRHDRLGVVASGDDSFACAEASGIGLDQQAVALAADGLDRDAEARLKAEALGIGIEIGHDLFARNVTGMAFRERHERQRGEGFHRVQMQSPVMPPPGRRNLISLFEDQEIDARLFEAGCDGEPGRAGADNGDIGLQTLSSRQSGKSYDGKGWRGK